MNEPLADVLLVEDEPQIRRFVRTALEAEGWTVHEAGTMKQGSSTRARASPTSWSSTSACPTATASTSSARLRGWSERAGDRAVGARGRDGQDRGARRRRRRLPHQAFRRGRAPRARARGAAPQARAGRRASVFRFGDVEVDPEARTVTRRASEVHLTPVEFRLLSLAHRERRQGPHAPPHPARGLGTVGRRAHHYVRVYMGHLRQKLEDDPAQPRSSHRDRGGLSAGAAFERIAVRRGCVRAAPSSAHSRR